MMKSDEKKTSNKMIKQFSLRHWKAKCSQVLKIYIKKKNYLSSGLLFRQFHFGQHLFSLFSLQSTFVSVCWYITVLLLWREKLRDNKMPFIYKQTNMADMAHVLLSSKTDLLIKTLDVSSLDELKKLLEKNILFIFFNISKTIRF